MTIEEKEELEHLQKLKENLTTDGNVLYSGFLPPYLRLHAYKMLKANNLPPVLEQPTPEKTQELLGTVQVKTKIKRKKAEKAARVR